MTPTTFLEKSGFPESLYRDYGACRFKSALLEDTIAGWLELPLFRNGTNLAAERLLEISLAHTYLFGRVTMPRYGSHFLTDISKLPPADDTLGKIIQENLAMISGEIATNNINNHPDDSHAHYHDLAQAYAYGIEAPKGTGILYRFDLTCRLNRIKLNTTSRTRALGDTPLAHYTYALLDATTDPLSTYLLVSVSEQVIRQVYEIILQHLNPEPRFSSFRNFMQKHIDLDRAEHGPASLHWLDYYLTHFPLDSTTIEDALLSTERVIRARIDMHR